jgi:hypothetical protein
MPNIPQITRDRLESSAVGTPGIDTSGEKIAQSLAQGSNEVGQAVGEYAINIQQNLDQAETNRLAVGYKEDVTNTLEKMKEQYANDPEKITEAYPTYLQNALQNTVKQASNPRVALMSGRGEPMFDGHMIMQANQWAFTQRLQNDKASVLTGANTAVEDAGKIVTKDGQTYDQMKQDMLPIFSRIGNLTAGAFASAHPSQAAKFQEDTAKSAYMNIVGKMIDHNPMWALQFLNEDDTKKVIGGDPMYERMQKAALSQVTNYQQNQEWNQAITLAARNPELMSKLND